MDVQTLISALAVRLKDLGAKPPVQFIREDLWYGASYALRSAVDKYKRYGSPAEDESIDAALVLDLVEPMGGGYMAFVSIKGTNHVMKIRYEE